MWWRNSHDIDSITGPPPLPTDSQDPRNFGRVAASRAEMAGTSPKLRGSSDLMIFCGVFNGEHADSAGRICRKPRSPRTGKRRVTTRAGDGEIPAGDQLDHQLRMLRILQSDPRVVVDLSVAPRGPLADRCGVHRGTAGGHPSRGVPRSSVNVVFPGSVHQPTDASSPASASRTGWHGHSANSRTHPGD